MRNQSRNVLHRLMAAVATGCAVILTPAILIAEPAPPGTLDATFVPTLTGFASIAHAITLQPDGGIVVVGDFTRANGNAQKYITRLSPAGVLDSTLQGMPGADGYVFSAKAMEDGTILVGGDFTTINGANWSGFARLKSDFNPDPSFGQFSGVTGGHVTAIAVQSDGKIIIGGTFTEVNGTGQRYLARLNFNGSLDDSFHPVVDYFVDVVALRPNGAILVGGEFTLINSVSHRYMVQFDATGTVDAGFTIGFDSAVKAIVLQPNGQALVGGDFTRVNGVAQKHVARLNSDGSRDAAFAASCDGPVYSLALQRNGKVVVGGLFAVVNEIACNNLARLNTNGVFEDTFVTSVGPNSSVQSIALQTDGKILISGEFGSFGNEARSFIARVLGDPPPPAPTPETTTRIVAAVEVGWNSATNGVYQVQWSPEVAPDQWHDLGVPVAGNGGTNWFLDSARGSQHKFYRVLRVQ